MSQSFPNLFGHGFFLSTGVFDVFAKAPSMWWTPSRRSSVSTRTGLAAVLKNQPKGWNEQRQWRNIKNKLRTCSKNLFFWCWEHLIGPCFFFFSENHKHHIFSTWFGYAIAVQFMWWVLSLDGSGGDVSINLPHFWIPIVIFLAIYPRSQVGL